MESSSQLESKPAPKDSGGTDRRFPRVSPITDSMRALIPLIGLLIGVVVYGTLSSDQFATQHNFEIVFGQITVLGFLSIAMMFLLIGAQVDLSIGAAAAFLSVIGAKLFESGASDLLVAGLLILFGIILGLAIGMIVTVFKVQPFILTLGATSVFLSLGLIITTRPIPIGSHFQDLAIDTFGPMPISAAMFCGFCVIGALVLRFTRFGRSAYALGANEEAAFLAGIPVARTKVGLYALSGLLVGITAIVLSARLGAGDPKAGTGLELAAIVAVVLGGASFAGGTGSMLGAFLGALFTGLITNVLQLTGVPAIYGTLVTGGILMIAVTWSAFGDTRRTKLRRRGLLMRRGQKPDEPGSGEPPGGRTPATT